MPQISFEHMCTSCNTCVSPMAAEEIDACHPFAPKIEPYHAAVHMDSLLILWGSRTLAILISLGQRLMLMMMVTRTQDSSSSALAAD